MDNATIIATLVTVINTFIGIIMGFILTSIRRIEDKHSHAVEKLHVKVDDNKTDIEAKREKDLTEMRDRFEAIRMDIKDLSSKIN